MGTSNPEIIAAIVGALVTFPLTIISAILIYAWTEKRQKSKLRAEITYSKTLEIPLKVAKDELKDKLRISYGNTEIENLYFYNLRIANTGNKNTKNIMFTCLFAEGTRSIDPAFPRISTTPEREVGPITQDKSMNKEYEYRFQIDSLGKGQIVNVDFLTLNNPSPSFDIIFRPNDDNELNIIEGEISLAKTFTFGSDDLETNLKGAVFGVFGFLITVSLFSFIPFIGTSIGASLGSIFLVLTMRSSLPIISYVARILKRQEIIQNQAALSASSVIYNISSDVVTLENAGAQEVKGNKQ